ncbi:MAG: TonB-dependent receptor [Bacteroides sp.]
MKKWIYSTLIVLFSATSVCAQTIYDVVNLSNKDLNGNARFVGMGGAMGALGANISTINTNPAGIGLYRSSDIMTSFSFSTYGIESSYGAETFKSNHNKWSYDNVGFVYSSKVGNTSTLRYVNFGFNYTRSKSFDKYMSMAGVINKTLNGKPISQTDQMAVKANQMRGDYGSAGDIKTIKSSDLFDHNLVGWLPAVGWLGHLYDFSDSDDRYVTSFPQPDSWFDSREKGGIDQYDFNVSFNFSDRFYLGFTVGAYDVNYSKRSTYGEESDLLVGENKYKEGYEMTSMNKINGSGVDFKLGAIVRPFEDSPLRFGLGLNSPIFYNLTYRTNVRLSSNIYSFDDKELKNYIVDSYDYMNNRDYGYDFRIRTPWKYNLSMGYTVGKNVALGAEYEYQDYSTAKMSYSDGADMAYENSTAKEMLKGVHAVRLGAEWKVVPQFALRCGYNYISEIFGSSAFKNLAPNSINTDTDYSNTKSQSNYTLGFGYQGSSFYADLAYQYSQYSADFYPFDHPELAKTKVTNMANKVLLTLGMRF